MNPVLRFFCPQPKLITLALTLLALAAPTQAAQYCVPDTSTHTTPVSDFTLADGLATHTPTGLMWKRCPEGQSWNGTTCTGSVATYDWRDALGQVDSVNASADATLNFGYTDWRLPNVKELASIIEYGCHSPAINTTLFPLASVSSEASIFWSSTPRYNASSGVYATSFMGGSEPVSARTVSINADTYTYSAVRLVRGGANPAAFDGGEKRTVAVSRTGSGSLSLSDGFTTQNCNSGCTSDWNGGSRVTVTATPPSGGAVTWGGACAGSSGNSCIVSVDAVSWVTADFSPSVTTSSVLVDPATATTLYAGFYGAGVYVSTNSGTNWSAATSQPANLNVKALAKQNGTPLYAATYGGGVFKAATGTAFTACASQPTNTNSLSLAMDAAGKLYAGTEAGVFVSSDQCATWSPLNNGLPN